MLRAKGILPPRESAEVTEEDLVNMVESTIAEKSGGEFVTMSEIQIARLSQLTHRSEWKAIQSLQTLINRKCHIPRTHTLTTTFEVKVTR